MANIEILQDNIITTATNTSNLIAVHQPIIWLFRVKLIDEGDPLNLLVDVSVIFEEAVKIFTAKPYLYNTDATYNYYRIQGDEYCKALMESWEFIGYDDPYDSAYTLVLPILVTVSVDYTTTTETNIGQYYGAHAVRQIKNSNGANLLEIHDKTFYNDKTYYNFHGYPFRFYGFQHLVTNDIFFKSVTNPNLINSIPNTLPNVGYQQFGQNQQVAIKPINGAIVENLGTVEPTATYVHGGTDKCGEYGYFDNLGGLGELLPETTWSEHTLFTWEFKMNPIPAGIPTLFLLQESLAYIAYINLYTLRIALLAGGSQDFDLEVNVKNRLTIYIYDDITTPYMIVWLNGVMIVNEAMAVAPVTLQMLFEQTGTDEYNFYKFYAYSNDSSPTEFGFPLYLFNDSFIQYGEDSSTTDNVGTFRMLSEYHTEGIMLRWLDRNAMYQHYLFSPISSEGIKTKSLGNVISIFDDISEADSLTNEIGMQATKTITLRKHKADETLWNYLSELYTSPVIYLFTGEVGDPDIRDNWIKVSLKSGNIRRNTKYEFNDFSITITLPEEFTQTL